MQIIDDYAYMQMSANTASATLEDLQEKINILAIELDKVQKKLNVMDASIRSLQGR